MTDITVANITTKTSTAEGTGVFDVLMNATELHLNEQYLEGRITGAEYGTVYLGALQSVLQQSINFVLQEQVADKQAELLTQQILTEVQNTRLADSKADESEFNVLNILPKQVLKLDEEIDLLRSQDAEVIAGTARQNSLSTSQVELNTQQKLTEVENTRLTDSKADESEFNVLTLLPIQKFKLEEEVDLLQSQDAEVLAATMRNDNESDEKLDLTRAQTAKEYEGIAFSQTKTVRENLLNNKQLLKIEKEMDNIQADTTDKTYMTTVTRTGENTKTNHDIAIKAQQEIDLKEKNGGYVVTYTYYVNGVDGTTTTTTDVKAVVGPILSTSAVDGEGISVTSLEKLILAAKDALIHAQTLGFASDTKQKLLKQMNDTYAVALSIAGQGNIPEASKDAAIDQLSQEILHDLSSNVTIQSGDLNTFDLQTPDTGAETATTNDPTSTD